MTRPLLATLALLALLAAQPDTAAAQADRSTVVVIAAPITPLGLTITDVRADGYVTLEDNSFWEPDLEDRPTTVTWRPNDFVVVKPIPAPRGSFDYWLINATRADTAAVRFAGRPHEPGPRLDDEVDGD